MWLLLVSPGVLTDAAGKAVRGEIPADRGAQLDQVPLLLDQPDLQRHIMKARAEEAPETFVWDVVTAHPGFVTTYLFMEFEDV